MASGTLYTYPENFRAYKALIAAQYSGASLKVEPDFVFGKTNKSKPFLDDFPAGKVPAFKSADGKVCLTESNAIAYYVSSAALRGQDALATAQVLQWLSWADGEVLPASCAWVFPLMGIMPFNKQTVERAKTDLAAALTTLNSHLRDSTFLVGERISLADISVFCTLLLTYQNVLEPSVRQPYPSVNRWFVTLLNQPQFKAVLGDSVKMCETAIVFDPKKVQKPAKEPKEESKKEQPKKEAKKEAKVEDEAMDDNMSLEPKFKDPFDAMPKGTFVMDDFKRVYSNEDETKSVPYFFEKFDNENYSIWFGEYKYNNELSKVFMSCNLITGMFQRLDKMRKQAFASCILFGDDNNSTISGVWVWRGQELAFSLSPDWQVDYETYDWKKLDISKPEDKKMVEQYFSWAGEDKGGRKFNQGKIFK